MTSICVNENFASLADTCLPDLMGVHVIFEQPAEFWETIPALVASKVRPALNRSLRTREPVIEYLRDLEAVARQESTRRNVVQVIASGRRLLGDEVEIGNGIRRSFQSVLESRA